MCLYYCQRDMIVEGTIGASTVTADISSNSVSFSGNRKIQNISPLKIVCFQRVNKRLKTCEIIYVDVESHTIVEQTIDRSKVDDIMDHLDCAIYMLGCDPLPWKRFTSDAKKYEWSVEDWQYLFEASSSDSDKANDNDSDWSPDDSSCSSSDDEQDEVDEDERPRKKSRN